MYKRKKNRMLLVKIFISIEEKLESVQDWKQRILEKIKPSDYIKNQQLPSCFQEHILLKQSTISREKQLTRERADQLKIWEDL